MASLLRKRATSIGAAGLCAGFVAAAALAQPAPAPSASAAAAPARLRGADIPVEPSAKPNESEWRDGKKVGFHRGVSQRCELVLVREWLRVLCKDWAGVGLVAGDPKGVTLWTGGHPFDKQGLTTMVQFPLVRGTARIVSFLGVDFGYDSTSLGEAGTLSVVWRDGDEDPVIGIYDLEKLDQ